MATVAELAARSDWWIAYLLVIDGLPYMFTDEEDLAGTTWISGDTDIDAGDRRVVASLETPETYNLGTDLDDSGFSGMLGDGGMSFTIVDFDGSTLLSLVKEPTSRATIFERLSPLDDPAPATLIGDGGVNVTIHDRYIGAENVGPAGERRRFQGIPGATRPLPGMDHAALDSAAGGIAAMSVTPDPEHAADLRRVYLYVIRKDVTSTATGAAAWPAWTAQHASGKSLIWVGTLSGVTADGPVWTLKCDGPAALLRRQINVNAPDDWRPVATKLFLNDTAPGRTDLIAVAFKLNHFQDSNQNWRCGYSTFDPAADQLTATTADGLRSQIGSRLLTLSAMMGPDKEYDTEGGEYQWDEGGMSLHFPEDPSARCAEIWLCAHESVWRMLGWDPVLQHRTYQEIETEYDVVFQNNNTAKFYPWGGLNVAAPGPGYFTAKFTTLPFGQNYTDAGVEVDNNGDWRHYRPLNPPNPIMLYPEGGQEIGVAFSGTAPYCEGQLARPPAQKTLESGDDCDSAGYMVFRGQYRESLTEDARELYQVAKVSWHSFNNTFSENNDGDCVVYIERWLDPRLFGYSDPPITKVWTAPSIEWAVIRVLGYNLTSLDHAHMSLLRLLLSTGTAQWDPTAFEDQPGATKTVGSNAHPDAVAPHQEADDLEIAGIGLQIPAALVNWQSFVTAAVDLPGGYKGPLNRVKLAVHGSQDSQDLIADILAPRAWAMGFDGYRYSLFSLVAPLTQEDVQVTLSDTDGDFATDEIPQVDLFPLAPFDTASLEFHIAPTDDGSDPRTKETKSLSPRTRGRHGNGRREMRGRGHPATEAWKGEPGSPPDFGLAWATFWGTELADYLAQPHEMLTCTVMPDKAMSINPGTVVSVTNPWPARRNGTYGYVNAVGRVLKVNRNLRDHTAEITVLVQAGDANTRRRFAPIAVVLDGVATVEERFDGDYFYCHADYFGSGETGHSDVKYFAEPAWFGVGGDAEIYGYQYDGREWQQTFSATVAGVDTTAHTIRVGALTGTFYDARFTVLALEPYDLQGAAWPKAMFVVHTAPDGTFGGAPGFKFTDKA